MIFILTKLLNSALIFVMLMAVLSDELAAFILLFIKLLIGTVMAIVSIYLSAYVFKSLIKIRTGKMIQIQKELKKRNTAVALVFGSMILSNVIVIHAGLWSLNIAIEATKEFFFKYIFGLLTVLFGIILSLGILFFAVLLIDYTTKDINEMDEIMRGNVPVAITMSMIIIGLAIVAHGIIFGVTTIFNM